jgi:putative ABC transport system permease protein
VRDRLVALPGVERVGFTSSLPLSISGGWGKYVTIEGRPAASLEQVPSVQYRLVNGDYFQTMGIPLKQGRLLNEGDSGGSPPVALVNETFARRFFGDEDPLGRRISMDAPENLIPLDSRPPDFRIVWRTIVGVVGDVKQLGLDQATPPEVYAPDDQNVDEPVTMFLAARAASDPGGLAAAVRRQVLLVDKDQPIAAVATMRELMDRSVSRPRFSAVLLTLFAAVALALALVGLYGVLSYAVSRRAHEIGIRMALGARRADVMTMIVGEGLRLTLAGIVLGILGAALLTRAVSGQLFGVSAIDPLTFGLVPPLFVVVALVASYFPARRATDVDPIGTLRSE